MLPLKHNLNEARVCYMIALIDTVVVAIVGLQRNGTQGLKCTVNLSTPGILTEDANDDETHG